MHARWLVHGKVQGVWYRTFVKEQADKLGIAGYAKNCVNGDVEVVAVGKTPAVRELKKACRKGSSLSRVDAITQQPASDEAFSSFAIL